MSNIYHDDDSKELSSDDELNYLVYSDEDSGEDSDYYNENDDIDEIDLKKLQKYNELMDLLNLKPAVPINIPKK